MFLPYCTPFSYHGHALGSTCQFLLLYLALSLSIKSLLGKEGDIDEGSTALEPFGRSVMQLTGRFEGRDVLQVVD